MLEMESFEGMKIPSAIRRLLQSRGILETGHLQKWINPKLGEMADPNKIIDMAKAVERIAKARQNQELICIYGDFDLDGSSGLAMLFEGFEKLGFQNLSRRQPLRLSEGYGFHTHIVEELAAKGVKVIVTVDVGISALAATQRANELGIDVIITDHHQPEPELPKALAVVNPNRKDCNSGLGYLCGTGVAFYLLRALKRKLLDLQLIDEKSLDLRALLDFFTIATLTDMVPLVEDNRPLVKAGLVQLANTQRAGLQLLLKELGLFGRPLTGQDVAIRFSPKLNALSRMERNILPIDIFLERDFARAAAMIHEVLDNNDERVARQQSGDEEAQRQLKGWTESDFVFLFSDKFHRGVVGLIATKICNSMGVPTFIGSLEGDQIVGSARLPGGHPVSLLKAMKAAEASLVRFGGHDSAAGFELSATQAKAFEGALSGFYKSLEQNQQGKELRSLKADTYLDLSEIEEELLHWIDRLGPYGQSFEVPKFLFKSMRLEGHRRLRGGHLKAKLEGRNSIELLLFSPTEQQVVDFESQLPLELVGELQWNTFLKQKSIQIVAKEVRRSPGY